MKKLVSLLAFVFCFAAIGNSQLIYYHWNPVTSPVTSNLNSIYNNQSTLLISGNDGKMLYRITPSTNWSIASTATTANLLSVFGSSTIFSVGSGGIIIKSTDNGMNWSSVSSPTSNSLNSVNSYVSQNYRMVCGDGGKIFITTNFGANWSEVPTATTNNLRNIYFNNNLTALRSYICGDNGTFLKLNYVLPTPVQITVTQVNTGVTNNFYGVSALGDTTKLMLVGSGGIIMKSTNAGMNWFQQNSPVTANLRFVYSVNANDVWVCGDNGTILHTTNGGTNWFAQVVNSSANLTSLNFISTMKALAVGSGGTILECNFPNPITDTTIKRAYLDGNNIKSYFQTTGIFNQNSTLGNTAGFEWPKGSGRTALFTSGLSVSALVGGNLRQAMCSYKGEYWPGQIISGTPQTPVALNKVWKVSAGDNCNNSLDWANWGMIVPYGAPYRDMNNNGQYDPCTDIPGMRNATQTIFMALTDGFINKHDPGEYFGGGTLPLNADLKITAYTYPDSTLADVQFIKFDLINRGSVAWNNVYMSLVGDFDLGDANDDYLATDSLRNMWIGFNGDNNDGNGNVPTYGVNPPAVGMRVLKFPVNKTVAPFDTLRPMTGSHFYCGGCIAAPCEFAPSGEPLGAYNYMKGFKKDGSKWMNPMFSPPRPVKFNYSGEPEPNSGWNELQGRIWNCGGDTGSYVIPNSPGDRRFLLGMGKDNFTMNPGDSQTIIVAQMIARGTSNLNSVTKLKQLSDLVANYTVGIKQISSYVPNLYALYQNYPNPFNPVTKIKFDIPTIVSSPRGLGGDLVQLKIFDITGREIQTLVNETLQPGTYETTFDGSNLTSGVYFYQLVSGNYKETKKLLLLK